MKSGHFARSVARPEVAVPPLYQGSVIKTHRDGFPWFSARRARGGDAKASQGGGPIRKHWDVRKPREAAVPVVSAYPRSASGSLDDAPHRPRLPSYPAKSGHDLYGSLSLILGMSHRIVKSGRGPDLGRFGGHSRCPGLGRCKAAGARKTCHCTASFTCIRHLHPAASRLHS